jgi:diacylglycerol kinase (ATP)
VALAAAVISAEALNTAVEALGDLGAPGPDERVRIAKDAAAGAVLSIAGGSVAVALTVVAGRAAALWQARAELAVSALLAAAAAGAGSIALWRPPWRHGALLVGLSSLALLAVRIREAGGGAALAVALALHLLAIAGAGRRERSVG